MQFTDANNRVWPVRLDIGTARQLKEQIQVDLNQLLAKDSNLFHTLNADMFAIAEVLEVLAQDAFDGLEVTPDTLARGLRGDAILRGRSAMWEAILGFFPQPQVREMLGMIQMEIERRSTETLEATLASLPTMLEKEPSKSQPSRSALKRSLTRQRGS